MIINYLFYNTTLFLNIFNLSSLFNLGVVALDGLLYVIGGNDGSTDLDSVEIYNPITNTWTMITASMNVARANAGVVAIDRPQHFKT